MEMVLDTGTRNKI